MRPVDSHINQTVILCLMIILLIALGPIQSLIWNGSDTPYWIVKAFVFGHAQELIHSALSPVLGENPYDSFGKLMVLVYAGTIYAITSSSGAKPWSKYWTRITVASLSFAGFADFLSYWVAGFENQDLRFVTFWLMEFPALVVCLLSLTASGITLWLQKDRSLYAALLSTSMLQAFLWTAVIQYMPHGPMLAVTSGCLAMTALQKGATPANHGSTSSLTLGKDDQ